MLRPLFIEFFFELKSFGDDKTVFLNFFIYLDCSSMYDFIPIFGIEEVLANVKFEPTKMGSRLLTNLLCVPLTIPPDLRIYVL